jgi:hypothetical protein|tara:strand:- start:417 stop:539 length:123 start_codon:yes stop_codon:yes gene_type:complete
MSNQQKDILLEKYYQEYLDKGLTPAEAERLANKKLEDSSV